MKTTSDLRNDIKKFDKHESQQFCIVHKPISLNKLNLKILVKFFV